ncbi:MAG: aminopeptidase [Alphaproteobacteria bacterium]|nr:aminopeptidase [Alphaproteobacteria bacterium]MCD8570129.1 aminopeptidase [Alphaproteobacteria bacterium]
MDQTTLAKLAHQFMVNAVGVQPGQNIWIEHLGRGGKAIADACAAKVMALGGVPYVIDRGSDYMNGFLPGKTDAELKAQGDKELALMKTMHGYIRVGDDAEQSRVQASQEEKSRYQTLVMRPMTQQRVENTNWLVTRAPTAEFAQACGMDAPTFEQFWLGANLADYSKMAPAAEPLVQLMGEKHKVRIIGKGTDLTFETIGGGQAKPCTGTLNIPDGEVFTAPVADSVNGTILYGPSVYEGERFESMALEFKDGLVVKAVANGGDAERTAALNKILDADPGARRIGEFAIAFNPSILHPVGDILFDEKINGSLHFALGQCYENHAPNGNKSAIHWDMVHIQRPEYGGGEIWFDDKLIRKDGRFVVPELDGLNPENL